MEEEKKEYKCVCFRCKAEFVSEDVNDTFGDGECKDCETKSKEIASKVDAIIAERRKNRPAPVQFNSLPANCSSTRLVNGMPVRMQ